MKEVNCFYLYFYFFLFIPKHVISSAMREKKVDSV